MKSEDSPAKPGSSFSERIGKTPLGQPGQLVRLTRAVYAAIRAHGERLIPRSAAGRCWDISCRRVGELR